MPTLTKFFLIKILSELFRKKKISYENVTQCAIYKQRHVYVTGDIRKNKKNYKSSHDGQFLLHKYANTFIHLNVLIYRDNKF